MALTAGTYALGPDSGRLLVRTSRSGVGRKVGHDLTIEVTRWSGEAVVDPADPASLSVTVSAEVDSLKVREGTGGIKPLTDSDRAEIEKNAREKILRAREHPVITFRSTGVEGTPEAFTITGDLTIMGRTNAISVRGGVEDDRVRGGTTVVQTRWGIKPYSALLGALKLADEVAVEFDLALPGAD
ncbi:YceI family protein [Actinoallomurus purpureus]|uniref:YceI family protein n=1 Tax=Actinoallomurus purpureus TaxID=478114 RepID=UPI0020920F84|nr:YceI family protein [Actinoallomurus purpureus]MCO6010604.1 YceI family protein [Actinoallomurus purpureus]